MNKLFATFAVAALASSIGVAAAQTSTTTTTTFSAQDGTVIREHSTTQKHTSFSDPNLNPSVGVVLPGTVQLHPLPPSVRVTTPEAYSYTIVNNRPIVVERTTRRVVHSFE